jgi:hypothetical protein
VQRVFRVGGDDDGALPPAPPHAPHTPAHAAPSIDYKGEEAPTYEAMDDSLPHLVLSPCTHVSDQGGVLNVCVSIEVPSLACADRMLPHADVC